MDGHFVPNYMLSPELLNKMRDMQALNENVDEKNNKVEPVSNVKGDKDNYFSLVNKYLGEIDTSLPEINIKDEKISQIKEGIEQKETEMIQQMIKNNIALETIYLTKPLMRL